MSPRRQFFGSRTHLCETRTARGFSRCHDRAFDDRRIAEDDPLAALFRQQFDRHLAVGFGPAEIEAQAEAQGREVSRLRLAVVADNSAKSIEAFVRASVKPGATLITDGHAAYSGLSGDCRHDPRVVGNMAGSIVLHWSHRAFSLLKRWALGTLRRKHVDAYFNEFVFRYNRRFHRQVSFETVLGLAAHCGPTATSSTATPAH